MAFSLPFKGTKGYETVITVALLSEGDREAPTANDLTNSALAAKGATSITLDAAATGSKIRAGQRLLFIDPVTDLAYPVIVTANYEGAGTTLAVAELAEDIPADAVAAFPAKFQLRQSAGLERSTNVQTFSTFDHAGLADSTPGQIDTTASFDGAYAIGDAGGETMEAAQRLGAEAYVEVIRPAPSAAYSRGRVDAGACLVESMSQPVPLEGEVSRNFSVRFNTYTVTEPTPTA